MCYEFGEWFTKRRSADQARKEQPTTEPAAQPREPMPEPQAVTTDWRVKERETAPA